MLFDYIFEQGRTSWWLLLSGQDCLSKSPLEICFQVFGRGPGHVQSLHPRQDSLSDRTELAPSWLTMSIDHVPDPASLKGFALPETIPELSPHLRVCKNPIPGFRASWNWWIQHRVPSTRQANPC